MLEALLRRPGSQLQHACDEAWAPGLAREGRRILAEAFGLDGNDHAPGSAAVDSRRPRSAGPVPRPFAPGPRCPALDGPALAELCGWLRLTEPPWPPARTTSSRAARLLAVAGALGRISLLAAAPTDQGAIGPAIAGEASAWALCRTAALLVAAAQRGPAGRVAPRGRSAGRSSAFTKFSAGVSSGDMGRPTKGMRRRGSSLGLASAQGSSFVASSWHERSAPQPGDEVLAHWMLPGGRQSEGVEDAIVEAYDEDRQRVFLQYADGLRLSAPLSWVVQRREPCRPEEHPSEEAEFSPPPACSILGVMPADGADYALQRLLQRGAAAGQVCARVRSLCARPRGAGLQPLAAALRASLAEAPESARSAVVEALCALCGSGSVDAPVARILTNAVLLSGCDHLPCTQRQLALLKRAAALSDTQRSKLGALFDARRRWCPPASLISAARVPRVYAG